MKRTMLTRTLMKLGAHTLSPARLKEKYASDQSRYVVVGDSMVHYCDEGDPQAPVLLLIHGVMASLHTWDGWVSELSGHYRIIRVDIPGFGLSHALPAENFNPDFIAEWLEQFVRVLGLDSFSLAGNSLGGFISWNYAVRYSQRVDKLILIDPVAYEQRLPWVMRCVSHRFLNGMARSMAPRMIVDACVRRVYGRPERIGRDTFDRYFELLMHPGHRGAMVDVFRVFRAYNGHPQVTTSMRLLKVPTLLMWGEKDAWVPPSHLSHWLRDVPHAESVVYPDAGHIPMEECPQETAHDARAFLRRGSEGYPCYLTIKPAAFLPPSAAPFSPAPAG